MDPRNTKAGACDTGASNIIQLWTADKHNTSALEACEQRFFRHLRRAVEIEKVAPGRCTEIEAHIAQRSWLAFCDHVRLSSMGDRA